MFCEECGTKNELGATFCESCGHKMPVSEPKKEKGPKRKLSKSTIIILSVIGVLAACIITFFIVGSSMTNPKNIAHKYFKAMADADLDEMYGYLHTSDSDFVSKELFKSKNSEDAEKVEIVKSKVNDMSIINKEKGEAVIIIDCQIKEDDEVSDVKQLKVNLKKSGKKLLFFDNWVVEDETFIINDVKVKVIKDSKVKIDGIELTEKYLSKDDSTDSMDVYVIPEIMRGKYDVVITLPFGFDTKDTTTFSYDEDYYTFNSYDSIDLPDETITKIEKDLKSNIQTLYTNAIDEKLWNSFKSEFEFKDGNLSDLESDYSSLSRSISRLSKKLDSITFSDVTIKSVYFSDGELKVNAKATYTYKLSYTEGEETKTYESKDSEDDLVFYLVYNDKNFKLVDMYSYNTYFSAY